MGVAVVGRIFALLLVLSFCAPCWAVRLKVVKEGLNELRMENGRISVAVSATRKSTDGCVHAKAGWSETSLHVSDLEIRVDAKLVKLPDYYVVCGLNDVSSLELKKNGANWVLSIGGGDTIDGYKVDIAFNADRVVSRREYVLGELSSHTIYYEVVIK